MINVKWLLAILGLLHSMATTGTVFGWSALLPQLVREGVYAERCGAFMTDGPGYIGVNGTITAGYDMLGGSNGNGTATATVDFSKVSCPERTTAFNTMFSAAMITVYVSQFFMGSLFDWIGPRSMAVLAAAGFAGGLLLLAFADSQHFDVFVPAYAILGWFGPIMQYTSSNFSNMFPTKRGLFVSLTPGMFTASTLNFLLVSLVLSSSGASRQTVLIGYTVYIGMLTLLVVWLYPDRKLQLNEFPALRWSHWWRPKFENALLLGPDGIKQRGTEVPSPNHQRAEGNARDKLDSRDTTPTAPATSAKRARGKRKRSSKATAKNINDDDTAGAAAAAADDDIVMKPAALVRSGMDNSGGGGRVKIAASGGSSKETSDRWDWHLRHAQPLNGDLGDPNRSHSRRTPIGPAWKHFMSREWLFMFLFHCVFTVRANYMAGAMTFHLASLGDTNGVYNDVWNVILPLGFLFVFITGPVIDRYGLAVAYTIILVDSLVYGAVCLIPALEIQPLLFLSFGPARPILFGTMFSYVAFTFGFQHLGKLAGITNSLTGAFQPLVYVLLELKDPVSGSYFLPNLISFLAIIPVIPFVVWLWYRTIQSSLLPLVSSVERTKVVGI